MKEIKKKEEKMFKRMLEKCRIKKNMEDKTRKKGCNEAKIDHLKAGKNGRQQMREVKDGEKGEKYKIDRK